MRFIPCQQCEGTGRHYRHDPQPDDPYLMTPTRDDCEVCGGEGEIEIEDEPIEQEDLL